MDKTKLVLLVLLVVVLIVTCIHPIFPHEQYLQHIGTVLLMIPLVMDLRKNRMPKGAFVGLVLFALFHIIGARYIYSFVPYKEWASAIGLGDSVLCQGSRNHYDRFVHFAFGVLLFPYFLHVCRVIFRQKPLVAVFMAWLLVQTGSLIYELFEWALTLFMSPEDADSYNGQQGDMWDAQKDMALAMLGSTLTAVFFLCRYSFQKRHKGQGEMEISEQN